MMMVDHRFQPNLGASAHLHQRAGGTSRSWGEGGGGGGSQPETGFYTHASHVFCFLFFFLLEVVILNYCSL